MHLKCHMLKSSDAIYLLTLLTNVIVETNNVDPGQQGLLCPVDSLSVVTLASTRKFGTYRIGEQRRLRRVCAYARMNLL